MNSLEKKIDALIFELGVPLRFSGSLYIKECLKLMLTSTMCRICLRQKNGCYNRVSDKLFGGEYNKNISLRLERSIRYAKEYIEKHLDADKLYKILKVTPPDHLTTKEFLLRLCEYIENNQA